MVHRNRCRPWWSIAEKQCGKKYTLRQTKNTPQGRKRLTKPACGTCAQASLELGRIHVGSVEDRSTLTARQAWEIRALPTMHFGAE